MQTFSGCLGSGQRLCWDLWEGSPRKVGPKFRGYPGVEGFLSGLPGADLLPVWLAAEWALAPTFPPSPVHQCFCPGLFSLAAPMGEQSDSRPSNLLGWEHKAIFTTLSPPLSWSPQGQSLCCRCLFSLLLSFYPASIFWMIREMQIRIMWYHCTHTRMAKIQSSEKTKCEQGCGAEETLIAKGHRHLTRYFASFLWNKHTLTI